MNRTIRVCILSVAVFLPSLALAQDNLDRKLVYRVDPNVRQLNVVPRNEIKEGFIYKYYHPELEKHVWGIAESGGTFRYAMGPGSMQPTDRFDLRISELEKQQLIQENAPALSRGVESLGRIVYARLEANDEWSINLSTSIPKVFDQKTNLRWEWHGGRRVGVQHSRGVYWTWDNDDYQPLYVYY